jgi:integrase
LWNKDLNKAKESIKWANPETFDISNAAVKESAKTNYDKINNRISDFETKVKKIIDILSKNTIGTRKKILKTFLAAANDRGIIVPSDYTKKSFKKPSEETFSIYLTESELMQMYNKSDMPKYLENVKDLFLIGCYTGLRFSDLSRLKKENITSDGTISIKAEKTEKTVVVPIHPIVRQIFEKYNYQLPKMPANQNYNDYIKIVAESAKINELVTIERSKGVFVVGQTTEKYKLVSVKRMRQLMKKVNFHYSDSKINSGKTVRF